MGKGQQAPASGPVFTNDPMAMQMQGQMRQQQMTQAMIDANRENYMRKGRALGQELFGHGTMPRINEGRTQEMSDILAGRRATADYAGTRSGGVQDVLDRRYAGLGGYSSPEYGALRSRAYEGFQNQVKTGQRQLMQQQAANRVGGGTAAAGMARFMQGANAEAAKAERDLMIADITERQNRLGQYEQSLTGAEGTEWGRQMQANDALQQLTQQIEQDELARQQYNNQQFQREKAGQLQAMLGYAGIGAGDLSTGVRTALANQQMQGALNSGGGGGGKGK